MPAKDSLYLTVLVSINGSTGGNIPLGAQLETCKKASKSREIRKIKKHEKRKNWKELIKIKLSAFLGKIFMLREIGNFCFFF